MSSAGLSSDQVADKTAMTLMGHLNDLRKRLVRSAAAILVSTIATWNFYPDLFAVIRRPFDDIHASHSTAILALQGVTSGFSLQLRVAMAAAVVFSSPIWIYQLWRFVAPGLHKNERKWAYIFTSLAVPLFLAGVFLAYWVMPRMLDTLFEFTPSDVQNVTSVDSYLSFFFHLTLFFGIGFLLPLFLVMLNVIGALSSQRLLQSWRWLVLGSFIFGAIATPSGDPLGMTFVAIPMLLLAGVALVISWLNDRRRSLINSRSGTNRWSDDEASPLD